MVAAYVVCQILLFGVLLWGRVQLRRFLRAHGAISDHAALAGFMQVARVNMLCSLAFLVFGVCLLVWGVFLATQRGMTGLAVVIACSLPPIVLALGTKKMENRARSLECNDPVLRKEYQRISEIWVKRAVPYF